MKTNLSNLAVITLSGLLVLATSSPAQPDPAATNLARDHAALPAGYPKSERLADVLQLHGDRRLQAKPILQKFIAQRDQLFADATLTHDAMAAKVRQLRLDTGEQLRPLLTSDQYGKWITLLDAIPRSAK